MTAYQFRVAPPCTPLQTAIALLLAAIGTAIWALLVWGSVVLAGRAIG